MDIRLLVISIDPEGLAAPHPEVDIPGKEQGFFHLNGGDVLSCNLENLQVLELCNGSRVCINRCAEEFLNDELPKLHIFGLSRVQLRVVDDKYPLVRGIYPVSPGRGAQCAGNGPDNPLAGDFDGDAGQAPEILLFFKFVDDGIEVRLLAVED